MADELTIFIQGTTTKGGVSMTFGMEAQDTYDVAASAYERGAVSVSTAEETLNKGDVGTIGYVFLKNLDATNYVEFGKTTTDYDLKLKAGEVSLVRWNGTNVLAKANTGACLIEYLILSD